MSDRVSNKKSGLKGARQYQYRRVSARRKQAINQLQERYKALHEANTKGKLPKDFNMQEEEHRIKRTIRSYLPRNMQRWLSSEGRQLKPL